MKYEDILKQEDLKNFLGYWEKSKSYKKDSVVAYGGGLYKSLTDYNINNTPSTTPTHWDSLIKQAEKDVLFGYYDKDTDTFYSDSAKTEELTAQVKKIYVDLTDDKFKEYMYSATEAKYVALGGDKHFYFERVLKASDWNETSKTLELSITQIKEDSLVTWNLQKGYSEEEYDACARNRIEATAQVGKLVFTTKEVPTVDIKILVIVESAEFTVLGWHRGTTGDNTYFTNTEFTKKNFSKEELEGLFLGKSVEEVIGAFDGNPAIASTDGEIFVSSQGWLAPIFFNGVSGSGLVFLLSMAEGTASKPDMYKTPVRSIESVYLTDVTEGTLFASMSTWVFSKN